MADDFESTNPELNAAQIYYNWAVPLPPQPSITTNIEGDTTIVTTINGGGGGQATGPTITITGGTTGLQFTATTSTITLSGVLVAVNGGTGQSSYAQGDLLYSSATNVLSKLAKDTNATRYLGNTGTANSPAWAQIDLTNGVTGILPNANGGGSLNNVTNVAPTVNDDSGDGYSVHSLWTDTTGPTTYICQSATVGAAVWTQIAP